MKKLSHLFSHWLLTIFLLAGFQFTASSQTATHLHFDGVDDYVNLPTSPLFNFGTGDFTTEAWIKTSSTNTQIVLGSSGSGDFWLGTTSGNAAFSITGTMLAGTTAINDNQWHHIAGLRQSGTLYIYVDGVLDGSLANNLSFTTAGQPLTLGRFNGGFGGYHFTGEVDEVRIWNAAQTAGNIAARRNNELLGNETGLLAYYKFNQGIAAGNNTVITTLTNSTANSLNGVITNFSLTGSTSNFLSGSPVTAPQGTHLHFDGVNDVVHCGTAFNTTFSSLNTVTVEAWVNPETTTGLGAIAGNYSYPSNNAFMQLLLRRDGTSYIFWMRNSTNTGFVNVVASNAVVLNTWQHVVGVRNGDQLIIYVDGVLVNTATGMGTQNFPANTGNEFTIGGNAVVPSPEFFKGSIEEVRVWTSAVAATEIARRKNCELQCNEPGLYAYYKFNHGNPAGTNTSVTTLTNSSATAGIDGILTNFALTGTTSNWLSGSPVTTGAALPSAPTAPAQSFCSADNPAVANLTPAPGTTINWYNTATAGTVLAGTAAVTTGTYYAAAVNANGCESERTPVSVTVNATTLAGINQNSTLSVTGTTNFPGCANLIAKVSPNGASPVNGSTTAKVWIESTQNAQFVKRHYEITPASNAATATGNITLYFTQAEFDDFNAVNTVDLPTSSADATGIANLLIEKRSGISSDGTGLPSTYTGSVITIDPSDADIIWNSTQSRWEISFDVTGFSGFFVKTLNGLLPLNLLSFNGNKLTINNVLLQWQTTHEINSSHFEIEVSSNGNSFAKLGTVTAKNSSGINSYQFTDNSSWASDTRYYRLKMIDNNTKFNYSTVIKMNSKQMDGISIYPNPVTDAFVLNVHNNSLLNTTAKITGISGSTIMVFAVNSRYQNIDISHFAKGMYHIRFADGSAVKLIKQ